MQRERKRDIVQVEGDTIALNFQSSPPPQRDRQMRFWSEKEKRKITHAQTSKICQDKYLLLTQQDSQITKENDIQELKGNQQNQSMQVSLCREEISKQIQKGTFTQEMLS